MAELPAVCAFAATPDAAAAATPMPTPTAAPATTPTVLPIETIAPPSPPPPKSDFTQNKLGVQEG